MAKVTIILEDTDRGLEVRPEFSPEIGTMEADQELTTAQTAAFDILQSLAEAADEVVLEDEVYHKSDSSKKGMH